MLPSRSSGSPTLVLRDPLDARRLIARPTRAHHRLGARLWAASLDRRLAAGDPPESHPLLATRAQTLVAPGRRRDLAAHWVHLLEVAQTGPAPYLRRLPLCRDRITAADAEVADMLAALLAPGPVPAAGVARASLLLSDGSGPLYNRLSPTDLVTAVRQVTGHLDPRAPLLASA
jgi:hypothetical protein